MKQQDKKIMIQLFHGFILCFLFACDLFLGEYLAIFCRKHKKARVMMTGGPVCCFLHVYFAGSAVSSSAIGTSIRAYVRCCCPFMRGVSDW